MTPVYIEEPATASLAPWIECGWTMQSDQAVVGHRVPPDGCVDFIYDREQGLRAIGAMTTEQRFDFPRGICLAGVRLRPGMAASCLGLSAAELTDRSVPLQDFWSHRAGELQRRLDDARSIRDAMRIMLRNLPIREAAPNPVQKAIQALTTAGGNVDLDAVAAQAGLSPRQFRRRCLEESGLSPKHLCRVLRFRHVCRIAGTIARPNWSDIALNAGYFDQAHLIRDFVEFTGITPMAVFSNTRS